MALKAGVRVLGIRPELVMALGMARPVFLTHGAEFVVTSIMEGTHKRASLHYMGAAADLRRPAAQSIAEVIVADLKSQLGDDFDVILESDHVHMEFQPKQPY